MKQQELRLASADREIRSLHSLLKTNHSVLETLLDRISERVLSVEDQITLTPFFILCGESVKWLQILRDLMSRKYSISWSSLVEALYESGFSFDEKSAQKLYQDAKALNMLDDLARTCKLDMWLPDLTSYRKELRKQMELEELKKKTFWLQQSDMYKSQDLEDKELEVLKFLSAVDPDDPLIQAKVVDLKKRRSKKLLESKIDDCFLKSLPASNDNHDSPADIDARAKITQTILERVQVNVHNPELQYAYAITLTQLEMFNEALMIFDFVETPNLSHYWLKLTLLKNTEQYLKAIELLDKIEELDPNREANCLAVQYERACLYFLLKQAGKAISLLQEMMDVNSDYRDVATLLRLWKGS